MDCKIGIGNWFKCLVRRKQIDSSSSSSSMNGQPQLARALSVPHITAIGIGTTIGAGVYILIGTVARECTGPALTLSFLFAGVVAALSAFCYAELASRCPSAGSAYHYSYVCVGEGVAWLIGWSLMLEYTIGGSAIARGISPNLVLLLGSSDSMPTFLSRQYIPALDVIIDPCAALLVLIVTMLLCLGIKESALAQAVVTSGNVFAMLFIIIAGGYLGFKTGWAGYELPKGYLPFGINGILAGSATVFFSYIGFDAVASAAEEVKNPKRDLPLGIAFSLLICCTLYMLVSVVVVGLIPYYELDPDTPISSAFSSQGMHWAAYIITIGASTALCASLLGSFLPQPRVLMAMARDGLLPSFFSDINPHTLVPVKSTIVTGALAAVIAFFMDVSQLAGMVSVGTLLSFTIVAISILIIRYVPPDEVPLPSSLQVPAFVGSLECTDIVEEVDGENSEKHVGTSRDEIQPLLCYGNLDAGHPLIIKQSTECRTASHDDKRRKIAGWTILLTCIGAFLLSMAASYVGLPSIPRFTLCAVGAALLISSLVVLSCINQDEARHSFGHAGGFLCPLIPLVPVASIFFNTYLLVNLGVATWVRVLVWLIIGVVIYALYGRNHSSLRGAVYVPAKNADMIFRSLCCQA
ncbi:cationic amino acid transporter 3, mitochondrial-like isoform X1 [Amaranthus tricolor]|uniref:cationic amino acid transporter 3, mitochondrial-like isoform X1 n=1 Tax=Amaranthus tricolor TaxID=29722 RepID=UPI00258A2761|nr:cationic amino acid transporter 3, mitochondrial-like isoform X1 [Amaranthus tricolor]